MAEAENRLDLHVQGIELCGSNVGSVVSRDGQSLRASFINRFGLKLETSA